MATDGTKAPKDRSNLQVEAEETEGDSDLCSFCGLLLNGSSPSVLFEPLMAIELEF